MKQLTQVLRTLSMKILKKSMLLLHVMTYSMMHMLLMLCPSLLLLGKMNWWIKWQTSRVVWRSSHEKNTSTKKFSSTMLVTMAREVLVHFRSQIKALLILRRSRLASSRKLIHIANIAKWPGTTLGSAPYHHTLFPLYHFLLSKVKGKVKAKFIGKITKESKKKLPQATLGPKSSCQTCARPKACLGS